ncbi:hypothetical protein JHK82_044048 [Glycine max]|nr:hypothetical protein JHK82_044048 [Glycine max]
MPIGVPRVPFRSPGEEDASWIIAEKSRPNKRSKPEVSRKTGMGNKTECTGFLARATSNKTKAGPRHKQKYHGIEKK